MTDAYRDQFDRLWAVMKENRPIAFGLLLARVTDHPKAAIMLSQLVYWSRHGRDVAANHGWVFKTREQWRCETGLSRDEQETARKRLKALGLIDEWRGGRPAKLWYRLNLDLLSQALQAYRRNSLPINLSFEFMRADERATREAFGPSVAYHRILADLTGSVNAALLLSRLLHIQRKMLDGGQAWISVTAADWKAQLGLNRRQLENAKHKLRQLDLIDEVLSQHRQKRVFTQVKPQRVLAMLTSLLDQIAAKAQGTGLSADGVRFPPSNFSQQEIPVGGKRTLVDGGKRTYPEGGKQPLQLAGNVHGSWWKTDIANARTYRTTALTTSPTTSALPADVPAMPAPGHVGVVFSKSCPPEQSPMPADSDDLIWPAFVRQAEQQAITLHRNRIGLPMAVLQVVLDEMAVRHRAGPIESPAGYARRLMDLAKHGDFVPERAHMEAERRQRAQQQVMRPEAEQRTAPAVARAHLAEVLAMLKRGKRV